MIMITVVHFRGQPSSVTGACRVAAQGAKNRTPWALPTILTTRFCPAKYFKGIVTNNSRTKDPPSIRPEIRPRSSAVEKFMAAPCGARERRPLAFANFKLKHWVGGNTHHFRIAE